MNVRQLNSAKLIFDIFGIRHFVFQQFDVHPPEYLIYELLLMFIIEKNASKLSMCFATSDNVFHNETIETEF